MKRKKINVALVCIFLSMGSIYSGCDFLRPTPYPLVPPLIDTALIAQYIYARPSLTYDLTRMSYNVKGDGWHGAPVKSSNYVVASHTLLFEFNLCYGCNPYVDYDGATVTKAKYMEYVVSFKNRKAEYAALRKYHNDTIKIPTIVEQFLKIAVADTLEYIHITADRNYIEPPIANKYYMDDIATVSVKHAGEILREYQTTGKYISPPTVIWPWDNAIRVSAFNKNNILRNLLDVEMSFYFFNRPPYRTDTFQFTFHWRYTNGTEYRTTSPRLIISQ